METTLRKAILRHRIRIDNLALEIGYRFTNLNPIEIDGVTHPQALHTIEAKKPEKIPPELAELEEGSIVYIRPSKPLTACINPESEVVCIQLTPEKNASFFEVTISCFDFM